MKNTIIKNQNADRKIETGNAPCKRLGSYVISDGQWLTVCEMDSDGLCMLAGKAFVDSELDVTWLSSWKSRSPAPEEFKTMQDFEGELAQLPLWNESRWACKSVDFGDAMLIDCKTGELNAESDEAKQQLNKIRAKIAMN